MEKFPEFFTPEAAITVPRGWVNFVERVFLAFSETGLKLQIRDLALRESGLKAVESRYGNGGTAARALNKLLEPVSEYCMICGARREPPSPPVSALAEKKSPRSPFDDDDDDDDEDITLTRRNSRDESPLCEECLKKFGIEPGAAPRARQ